MDRLKLCGATACSTPDNWLSITKSDVQNPVVNRCHKLHLQLQITRKRLRSTMRDEWFSSLTILACERDILESQRVEDIVASFASILVAPTSSRLAHPVVRCCSIIQWNLSNFTTLHRTLSLKLYNTQLLLLAS